MNTEFFLPIAVVLVITAITLILANYLISGLRKQKKISTIKIDNKQCLCDSAYGTIEFDGINYYITNDDLITGTIFGYIITKDEPDIFGSPFTKIYKTKKTAQNNLYLRKLNKVGYKVQKLIVR